MDFKKLVVVMLGCILDGHVAANDFPEISGGLALEAELERVTERGDEGVPSNVLEYVLGVEGLVKFSAPLSLEIEAVFEPVSPDRSMDYLLFIERLSLDYAQASWGVFGGKFNPDFGLAPDVLFGLYATDMMDYEIEERVGLGGYFHLTDELTLTGSGFFADTTALGRTYLNRSEQLRLEDGGVSNTEDLSSYTLGLFTDVGGFEGYLGYALQSAGIDDEADEESMALGVSYAIERGGGSNVVILPVLEFVGQKNARGIAENAIEFLTFGADVEWGEAWRVGLSKTWRWTRMASESEVGDWLVQAGVEYRFNEAISLELSWHRRQEEGVRDQRAAMLFVYEKDF